jgi:hypothetical protein
MIKFFNKDNWSSPSSTSWAVPSSSIIKAVRSTIFQDYLRVGLNFESTQGMT